MFVVSDKATLLRSLEETRKSKCHYMESECDCKFGGPNPRGEKTGCPELRTAMAIIDAMSQDQIDDFLISHGDMLI